MTQDVDFQTWIGRSTVRSDVATAAPLRGLAALLDRSPDTNDLVPPLGHWLYFLPDAAQADIGEDGHPKLGGELPDFGLPRRMWAGSRIEFLHPITVGAAIEKRTTIADISRKAGSTGPLAFVTLKHEIIAEGRTAIVESQDLVYREPVGVSRQAASPRPQAPVIRSFSRQVSFDAIKLFRFSALTFNAHRIHYDRDYALNVEGYPGLVVHGPYQAMLLLDLFRQARPETPVKNFTFRSQAPLFDSQSAELCLDFTTTGVELALRSEDDRLCMKAVVGI
jgi:3-methylfumaryl-CoA hydratase